MQSKVKPEQVELVNVPRVVAEQREAFQRFKGSLAHVSPFLRNAMVRAYAAGSDDMARAFDAAKVK